MNTKGLFCGIIIGIAMAIIWSFVFVNILHSNAGYGVGLCFGVSFGLASSFMFSAIGNKEEKTDKEDEKK